MSTIMPESTTEDEDKSTIWENITWRIGYRTNMLGEYLLKLGDRISGDLPMGINDAFAMGEASGRGDGLYHHVGRVGPTLTAMLTATKITVEDLAAETNMTADRVRDLADDEAVATGEEIKTLANGLYMAANAKRRARYAATA
jgi:hypothetical protein